MSSDSLTYDLIEDKAILEVGKVLGAVLKHGAYSSVRFDDAVTQAVIAHMYGGWPQLCVESDKRVFRWEFIRTWVAYYRQGVKLYGHLPGLTEISNCINGFDEHTPPPKLVGDQDMSGKPKLKPGTPGSARMEYYACHEDVLTMLAEGYHARAIYDYMVQQGRVTCCYGTFGRYVQEYGR